MRDINLSKKYSELLRSRLQGWDLLQKNSNKFIYQDRYKKIPNLFFPKYELCYCNDINSLISALNYQYKPEQWRIFIDGSKHSLKAVLFHNANALPSIPIEYFCTMKESYENMNLMLNEINYSHHN